MRKVLSVVLFLSGCVHTGPEAVAASVWHPAGTRQLTERGESLISGDIRISWAGDSWRGAAWGELVELETSPTGVNGFVGGAPVRVTVELGETSTTARGVFTGQQGELRLGPTKLDGIVGRCSYDLKSEDGRTYAGFRTCGAPLERTTVKLLTLGSHPLGAGRLAPLLLLLSR